MRSENIRSGEELTLKKAAFQIFHGGNSSFINSFDKTKLSCLIGQFGKYHNTLFVPPSFT